MIEVTEGDPTPPITPCIFTKLRGRSVNEGSGGPGTRLLLTRVQESRKCAQRRAVSRCCGETDTCRLAQEKVATDSQFAKNPNVCKA